MKRTVSTEVFVDDYVLGRLPGICVVTGEPTGDRLASSIVVDGPSPAWWLLVLLGPIGWLVLILVMVGSRRSTLTGELPMSAIAYQAARHRDRLRWLYAATVVIALLALALAFPSFGGVGLVLLLLAVGVAAWIIADRRSWPQVTLDASRRWVKISGVHPAFADTVGRSRSAESHRL